MAGLGLVHSLYRAHRAVVPATAWHLVIFGASVSVISAYLFIYRQSVGATLRCTTFADALFVGGNRHISAGQFHVNKVLIINNNYVNWHCKYFTAWRCFCVHRTSFIMLLDRSEYIVLK